MVSRATSAGCTAAGTRSPRRLRLLLAYGCAACVLVSAATGTLGADERAAEPRGTRGGLVEGPAMTALAAGELGRSSHVALGSVRRLRDVRGLMIAHVEVERWLLGGGLPGEITVMVAGPRPGGDSRAPSQPYFDRRVGITYVMFLVRRAEGEAFELENRQAIEGLEGAERLRAVEAQVALAQIPQADERARRVLEHFVGALEARGIWTRANAARELNFLVGVRPDVFDASARLRIARASESASAPTMRSWLKILERRLENVPIAPPPAGGPAPASSGLVPPAVTPSRVGPVQGPSATESPDAVLARLDASLTEAGPQAPARAEYLLRRLDVPQHRAAVVDWLAAAGHCAALDRLRAHYAREEDPGVREAIVRAHGLLGSDPDVPWIVERLANQRLQEAALLALARIRTPAARAALESFATARRAGNDEERELADRVEQLLSPAFEASEPARPTPQDPPVPARR